MPLPVERPFSSASSADTPQGFSCRFAVFEGPLDLLLHLIQKHKLTIDQIDITVLLEQYLAYLAQLQSQQLEVTTAFLTMAAHLVYIKTIALLPLTATEDSPDAETLTRELSGQLMAYQHCQQIATRLKSHFLGDTIFVRPPLPLADDISPPYQKQHDAEILARAYRRVKGMQTRNRPLDPYTFAPLVSRQVVSVRRRVTHLLTLLSQQDVLSYDALFPRGAPRSEMVATFLAVLSLLKESRLEVRPAGENWMLAHLPPPDPASHGPDPPSA